MIKYKVLILIILFSTNFSYSQQSDVKKNEVEAVQNYINKKIIDYRAKEKLYILTESQNQMAEEKYGDELRKIMGPSDRKSVLMNGNKLRSEVYNYGGIGPGYGGIRGVNDFVWRNLSYVFQFCPIVGASVPEEGNPNKKLKIISDALYDYPNLREVNPTGDTLWQWQPLPGFADPDQPNIATNPAEDLDGDGKPDSWPRSWYNPNLGKYVWPGFLSLDATNADLETYWAMDDRYNSEFEYYPFLNDKTRRGLGIQIDARAFQWSNALAENAIFFFYTITNVSDKDLDSVFFGIYGDPDLGGGAPENTDDHGTFIPPYADDGSVDDIPVYARSMVYFFDPDRKGNLGLPLGFLGCKFLESPGNAENGIDDDGDGMIDERQDDGIDNDGDWNPDTDDLGLDGTANTGDEGEGDGFPTAGKRKPDGSPDALFPGEPNFEFTDLDEADQIGLTSFNSWTWNQDKISNDESMWFRNIPRNFSDISNNSDIVFIFGSGYISLKKGESKRISMALLLGRDLNDLLTSAETVQRIYNQNYRFFKPPTTPTVTAIPGDKKVTLYWDTKAEESIDPITGKDFEGYVIYRSTDPDFNDIQKITDGQGAQFLSEPLQDINGNSAKWDVGIIDEPFTDRNFNGVYDAGEPYEDINQDGLRSVGAEDIWKGYHPIPYQGRGIHYYLGDNTGLVHSYVDSNNVINGQTYYYAVVAYDHGDKVGIPPSETTKKITLDPITSRLKFDQNTVQVIPGPRVSGYVEPKIKNENIQQTSGIGTGDLEFEIMNDLTVIEGNEYEIIFAEQLERSGRIYNFKNYSVLNSIPVVETISFYDTNFTTLKYQHLVDNDVVKVEDLSGRVYNKATDYVINYSRGSIRRTGESQIPFDGQVKVTYQFYPVYQSELLKGEDSNPVFDGVRLKVYDEEKLQFDPERSMWISGNSNLGVASRLASIGSKKELYPADYEIEFSSQDIDSAVTLVGGKVSKIPVNYTVREVISGLNQRIQTFLNENPATRNSKWDVNEEIILFKPGAEGTTKDTTTWGVIIINPADSTQTPILPTDGDVLLFASKRPFNKNDKFKLVTTGASVDNELASSRLDNIYVVPNPYVGLNDIEPTNKLPGQTRGERRIYFENLPQECTIRIFTMSGDLVQTLNHQSGLDSGREYWNLLNRDGFSVAYGVYFAHIDAPGIGEKLIKFALIK